MAQMPFPQENPLSCDLSRIAYVAAAGLLHNTTSHVQRKRDIQRKTPSLRVQKLARTEIWRSLERILMTRAGDVTAFVDCLFSSVNLWYEVFSLISLSYDVNYALEKAACRPQT